MQKSGIKEYQKSIKLIKQEIDLIKQNPNLSLLGTSISKENNFNLEDKENNWKDLYQVINGDNNTKSNLRNTLQQTDKLNLSRKYDHHIISLEDKMQTMKQSFIEKKNQEIIQVQNDMESMMERMGDIQQEENLQLLEKIKKIKERYEENVQHAKQEFDEKLQKYQDDMHKKIEQEKERTEKSIQQQIKNIESTLKLGNKKTQLFSQQQSKQYEDKEHQSPSNTYQIKCISQIKPQIPFSSSNINTQDDYFCNSTILKTEHLNSKRDLIKQIPSEKRNTQHNRSSSNSSSDSKDDRYYKKNNDKNLTKNHPIHKIIESNYKMNNKEVFSLIKKYKKINQSYEQGSNYTQQYTNRIQDDSRQEIQKQDQLEKNFSFSRKLSFQDDNQSQSNYGYNNVQHFNTQQSNSNLNILNSSYSNNMIDNFHIVSNSNNKLKLNNSFHSTQQTNSKHWKDKQFYDGSSNKNANPSFKPPINSRKTSSSQICNTLTSNTSNRFINPPSINGKFYISNSLTRKNSNPSTQPTKRSSKIIDISISDDSF